MGSKLWYPQTKTHQKVLQWMASNDPVSWLRSWDCPSASLTWEVNLKKCVDQLSQILIENLALMFVVFKGRVLSYGVSKANTIAFSKNQQMEKDMYVYVYGLTKIINHCDSNSYICRSKNYT